MPNICIGTVKVRGYKDNVEEFTRIIQSKYDYDKPDLDFHKPHFWRVFEAYLSSYETYGLLAVAEYDISCAWSVAACMLPGKFSYYDDTKDGINGIKTYGTHLLEIGKKLNLDVEIFSSEPGVGFQEHYRIQSGIMCEDECTEYHELYIGEYETYQDLIDAAHEKGIKIVQDIVINHAGNFGEATLAPMDDYEGDDRFIKECGINSEEDFKHAKEINPERWSPDARDEDFSVCLHPNDLALKVMCKVREDKK